MPQIAAPLTDNVTGSSVSGKSRHWKGIQGGAQKFQGDILNTTLGHKYHQAHLNLVNEVRKLNKKRLF